MRSEFEIPEIMLPEIMFPDLMRIPQECADRKVEPFAPLGNKSIYTFPEDYSSQ